MVGKRLFHKKNETATAGMTRTTSVSSISDTISDKSRRCRISERSLNPLMGTLKNRLSSLVLYWASTTSYSQHYCQLHYWATGVRKYQNVVQYKECNVVLCTDGCFEKFHTDWDLAGKKAAISAEYEGSITSEQN